MLCYSYSKTLLTFWHPQKILYVGFLDWEENWVFSKRFDAGSNTHVGKKHSMKRRPGRNPPTQLVFHEMKQHVLEVMPPQTSLTSRKPFRFFGQRTTDCMLQLLDHGWLTWLCVGKSRIDDRPQTLSCCDGFFQKSTERKAKDINPWCPLAFKKSVFVRF